MSTSFEGKDGVSFGGVVSIKPKPGDNSKLTGRSIGSHPLLPVRIGLGKATVTKEESGEEGAMKEDSEEEGGHYKSNHTVLLYFTFIILLVLSFRLYFFLPFFFDIFLY